MSQIGNQSNSRAVMHRAFAYSLSYTLTWFTTILVLILDISGVWAKTPPYPQWQITLTYFTTILNPLQGMFNFLIFMHPRVVRARRSHQLRDVKISWCRAFAVAFSEGMGLDWKCGSKHPNEAAVFGGVKNDRGPNGAERLADVEEEMAVMESTVENDEWKTNNRPKELPRGESV